MQETLCQFALNSTTSNKCDDSAKMSEMKLPSFSLHRSEKLVGMLRLCLDIVVFSFLRCLSVNHIGAGVSVY